MKRPTLPAPAIATRISAPSSGSMCACSSSSASIALTNDEHVALLADHVAGDDLRLPEPGHRGEPEAAGLVERAELLADRRGRDRALDEADLAGRVDPVVAGLVGQEPPQHLVGRPRDGRDRRDAEPLVDERAARVVDAGDDALDAVRLACDPGAQDVGVVAVRHGREGAGLVDARLRRDDRGRSRSRRSCVPPKSEGRRRNARPFLSITDTVWSASSSAPASSLPTRPHPITTTCTGVLLACDRRRMLRRTPGSRRATPGAARRAAHRPHGMLATGGTLTRHGCRSGRECSKPSSGSSSVARSRRRSRSTSGSPRRSRSRSSPRTRSPRPRTRPRRSCSSPRSVPRRASSSASTTSSRSRSGSRS